jgi:hypothetical protein
MAEETKITESNTRTRINLGQTAKGLVQFDITCEYDTPEESLKQMEIAVNKTRELIKKLGLKSVDDAA